MTTRVSDNMTAGVAPLASPALTGTPTAPTAAADTNTTQVATTAFVVGQAGSSTPLMDGTGTVGTSKKFARDDHRHPTDTSLAPLASPSFSGTPQIPGSVTLAASQLNVVAAGYNVASSQSLPINASTVINFSTKEFDTDNAVTVGAAWKFTVPTGKGGLYSIQATVSFLGAVASAQNAWIELQKNGSVIKRGQRVSFNASATVNIYLPLAATVSLAAGDYLSISIWHNLTGTASTEAFAAANWVAIQRIAGS